MDQHPIYSIWTSKYATYDYDDYFSIMIAMGCHMKCPFCVVGHTQGAKTGRAMTISPDKILDLALERRERYGTNLVKLFFSSSFSTEGHIDSTNLKSLLDMMQKHGFSSRVGSLNVKQADEELFQLLKAVGQTEVTFAPETSEELRPILGKGYIVDDKLITLASYARKYGFSMNIYSLTGLPGESDDTIRNFAALLRSLRKELGSENRLIVHFNPVFMKAQTPFQYLGNTRPSEARRKFALLKSELEGYDIEYVSIIDDPMVYYQPVLALGDFNSGKVLAHLYKRSRVEEADWKRAFIELGFDDSRYFTAKDPHRRLPWEHIVYRDHRNLKRRAQHFVKLLGTVIAIRR